MEKIYIISGNIREFYDYIHSTKTDPHLALYLHSFSQLMGLRDISIHMVGHYTINNILQQDSSKFCEYCTTHNIKLLYEESKEFICN